MQEAIVPEDVLEANGDASGPKPTADQRFAAAVELASAEAGSFRRSALRYSLCQADAEDAYQRGLEILLTKAPTGDRTELRRWLHTVIKHEALAIRRQRQRVLGSEDELEAVVERDCVCGPDERAPDRERVRQTAEALGYLKPAEIQCLLLKALGYSYDEIARRTGFSWTKVNRSLTEGRRHFFERYGQISSGEQCRRLEPLLSSLSDDELSAADERHLRAHLKRCTHCRALLPGYRRLPARLAQLLPPLTILPALHRGGWWSRLLEATSVQKATAVVASTAAVAGGVAVERREVVHHRSSGRTAHATPGAGRREYVAPRQPLPVTEPRLDSGRRSRPESSVTARSEVAEAAPAGDEFELQAVPHPVGGDGEQAAGYDGPASAFERPASGTGAGGRAPPEFSP